MLQTSSSIVESNTVKDSLELDIKKASQQFEIVKSDILQKAGKDYSFVEHKSNPQSMHFMADIVPIIERIYPREKGKKINLNVLDVGPRTGAGSGLLAKLYSPQSWARIKMKITAMDIDDTFQEYANFCFPEINYVVGDIYDIQPGRKWDLVICSHTIEHVPDPKRFAERLIELSKGYVIISCPFLEDKNNLCRGHVNSITLEFIAQFDPLMMHIYDACFWHKTLVGVFAFKGKGK